MKQKKKFNVSPVLAVLLLGAIFLVLGAVVIFSSFTREATISFEQSSLTVKATERAELVVLYEEGSGTPPELSFSTSNAGVASVSEDGSVLGLHQGTCEITCMTEGGQEISIPVEVTSKKIKKKIFLTFEDGPGGEVTEELLNVLLEYEAKATFFPVGYEAEANPELIQREMAEGHTIGVHTYSHDYSAIYQTTQDYIDDFDKAEKQILELTGMQPAYWRFPGGGETDLMSADMKETLLRQLHSRGYTEMDWNCSIGDSLGEEMTEDELVERAITAIDVAKVPVVLIHDASTNVNTPEVVRRIIEHYSAKGYKFLGLSDYTGPEMCFGENSEE